jgi:hypothetical protein
VGKTTICAILDQLFVEDGLDVMGKHFKGCAKQYYSVMRWL